MQQALDDSTVGSRDASGLMEKRVALFDGCSTIEAGPGSCAELEAALEEMTTVLTQQCESKGSPLPLSESATEGAVAEVLQLKAAAPAGFDWGGTF